MADLILTRVGPDRPGTVEGVADVVAPRSPGFVPAPAFTSGGSR